jgi:hypothetical protein
MNAKWPKLLIKAVLFGVICYLLSFFLVFDITSPARYDDEEDYNGKPVAFGPEPRDVICHSTWSDEMESFGYFEGKEWAFYPYAPLCTLWRWWKGYEVPSPWRK